MHRENVFEEHFIKHRAHKCLWQLRGTTASQALSATLINGRKVCWANSAQTHIHRAQISRRPFTRPTYMPAGKGRFCGN